MAATRITVMNNGSLRVEGDFEIVDSSGQQFGLAGRARVSLCRCGQSTTKPFCDSTHKTCGFESVVVAFDLRAPAAPPPSNPATAAAVPPASSAGPATPPIASPPPPKNP